MTENLKKWKKKKKISHLIIKRSTRNSKTEQENLHKPNFATFDKLLTNITLIGEHAAIANYYLQISFSMEKSMLGHILENLSVKIPAIYAFKFKHRGRSSNSTRPWFDELHDNNRPKSHS